MVRILSTYPPDDRVEEVVVPVSESDAAVNLARAKAIEFLGRILSRAHSPAAGKTVRLQAFLLCPLCADTKETKVCEYEHGRNVIERVRRCDHEACEPKLTVDEILRVVRPIFGYER